MFHLIVAINMINVNNLSRIVKNSFARIKEDFSLFKQTMHDWIFYLDHRQKDLDFQVKKLESRIEALERIKEKEIF